MSNVLLPPNATTGERALEQATARVGDVPVLVRAMHNPDTIPASLLPWMAWAFSVDEWSTDWSVAQKRGAIKAAYNVQRHKGTVGAVRSALSALGIGVQIIEWFADDPVAAPYTFRIAVVIDQEGATQQQLVPILRVVTAAKNLRSHLTGVGIEVNSQGRQVVASATVSGNNITVMPE